MRKRRFLPMEHAAAITRFSPCGRGSASPSVRGRGAGGSQSRSTSHSPGTTTLAVPIRPLTTPTRNSSAPILSISFSRRPSRRSLVALTKSSGKSNNRFIYDARVNIETRKKGDVIIVDFQGRLAVGVGDELLPALIEQLLSEGNRKILLNLSDMDYIDSNGL